jgi:cystathionine beta-synthase
LREQNPKVRIIGVEPTGSIIFGKPYHPFFQSGSGSAKMIFKNVDFEVIDENFQVNDRRAFTSCLYMAQRKGLMFGGSSGSVIFGAIDYLTRNDCSGIAVAIIPDGGERYLSNVYNREWMNQHDLLDQQTWDYLYDNV